MNKALEKLVRKYKDKSPYEKLALTEKQKVAVAELETAIKKCYDYQVAFVCSDYGTYAFNREDVYDFNCLYNDYSCRDVELSKLHKVKMDARDYEKFDGTNDCTVSFYSTTFTEGGEGIIY